MSSAFLFLAAAASSQPAYPADEILDAFQQVCFAANPYAENYEQFAAWKQSAGTHGWEELAEPTPSSDLPERLDYEAFYHFKAMDYAFISSMMGWSDRAKPPGSAIFKKQLADRAIYVSIVTTEGGSNPSLSECRLYDPMGSNGIKSSPLSREVIERWSGSPVKRQEGVYGGKAYRLKDAKGMDRSIRVHFRFFGRPLPRWGGKFEPYQNRGLTLVASNYSLIIVT